ncbi:DUF4258 domain-containing protein [Candidatus Woesearchaeota archaeon]|jgi:hypothetical protein|nr:DUF4258 domain-containing protein [Candidatus Woesearchaeota archaeon]MBT3538026.1 DUF4258 domain-containing protein [Candidatus Woesearchaeota archaeon]MBT4697110.1 DUF4258 domain-containing protein [Candidatus Woesearchaeota archaeon]MBT4717101.1 DUF4258 domain-containing protein [Candidatus Woesearchaeota archaeon]MBT7105695.1 DUF4258 domain-containing protein [Candidatus Woesearchaeota archaeon]
MKFKQKVIFTNHAMERMLRRGVFQEEVISTVFFPAKSFRRHDKSYFQKDLGRGWIEVCCEKTQRIIKVITVYWL